MHQTLLLKQVVSAKVDERVAKIFDPKSEYNDVLNWYALNRESLQDVSMLMDLIVFCHSISNLVLTLL